MRTPTRTILTACALSAALLVAGCVDGNDANTPSGGDLFLQPAADRGPDPFTASTSTAEAAAAPLTRTPQPAQSGRTGPQSLSGETPGLYGGTRGAGSCDVQRQIDALAADRTRARVFARAAGVSRTSIPGYLRSLTSVVLRADTRVTNHGFRDGEANGFQSLLEAGTAVLVDNTGVPRVKCNCGNPLAEPTALGGASQSDAMDLQSTAENPDDAWEGLDPAAAVKVEPADTPFEEVTLVDFTTAGLIQRPVGSDGASKPDTGTGDVQVTLAWASDSDLDLHVTEPDGTEIYYLNTGPSATGGQLDVDSNVDCVNDGGVENIFWPVGDAPSGDYTVSVQGFRETRDDGTDCGGGDFTLSITVAGQESTQTGTVAEEESVEFPFSVP